ncbi:unnamed protein product [Prunus armeniaca]
MARGVIWWVLIEIQWLKLCNTPTTPFHNELPRSLNCPISWTNQYRMIRLRQQEITFDAIHAC